MAVPVSFRLITHARCVTQGLMRAVLFVLWTLGMGAGWLVFRPLSSPVTAPGAPRSPQAGSPLRPTAGNRSSCGAWALHLWARGVCRILGVRIVATGRMCRAPALHVSNHVGYLDVIVLAATAPALFVARDDLARWPLLGFLAASTGTVFLDRTRPRAVVAAGERMAEHFAAGASVIVFPEGTTTDGATVAPFHASLFEPARRAQAGDTIPVQAIAVRYEGRPARGARGAQDETNGRHGTSRGTGPPDARGTPEPKTRTGGGDTSPQPGHDRASHPRAVWTGEATFLPHLWKLLCADGLTARIWCAPAVTGFADRRAAAAEARAWIASVLERSRK